MPGLRRKWMMLTMLAAAWSQAGATSCRPPAYDVDDGRRWFGPAERVFIGNLEQVDDPRENENLEFVLTNPAGSVRGQFRPREVFKGPDGVTSVRVNPSVKPGENYLVFARRDGSELRADGACAFGVVPLADPLLEPYKQDIDNLVSWLRTLPPAGSGGELRLYLRDDDRAIADAELRLEGPVTVSLRTDDEGRAHRDSIPAGTYRLATAAPPGYRHECYPDCTRLVVHDRGLDDYAIKLNPRGRLRVRIVDADDKAVPLIAQFDLYRTDGRRVGRLGSTTSRYEIGNGQDDAAVGFVEPGRYVLALVLPGFSPDGSRVTILTRHFDLDAGAANAPVVEVHDGDNLAYFHLAATLQPVLMRVRFSGEPVDDALHRVGWNVLAGREKGAYSEPMMYSPPIGEAALTLRVIPGQTLQYVLYGYDINGLHDTFILQPEQDQDIDLKLRKR